LLFYRRIHYIDPVCENLQTLLDSGELPRDSIFYIYLINALAFVNEISNPEQQFQWDDEVIEFVETLKYHGHEKVMNLLRGPGFLDTGKGGKKQFDWTTWNWPLPGKTTRSKRKGGYTTDSGLHKHLLQSFLSTADQNESTVSSLIDTETVRIIPTCISKDGMSIKPGMQVDIRQGKVVGTTENIDLNYVKLNTSPTSEQLKKIFLTEAEASIVTTLDNKLTLPLGAAYNPHGIDSAQTKESFEGEVKKFQACFSCSRSGTVQSENGIIINETQCESRCNECLSTGNVCDECIALGHKLVEPALLSCNRCRNYGHKCVKGAVLALAMDSESKNQAAFKEFEESREIMGDPCLSLTSCFPDAVRVGKRISRSFSNWFIIVQGYRINRILLRTLRNDPYVKEHLKPHLSLASCRNRDRWLSSHSWRFVPQKCKT